KLPRQIGLALVKMMDGLIHHKKRGYYGLIWLLLAVIWLSTNWDTGGEVKKHARIQSEHFSISSLNNHFATSINWGETQRTEGPAGLISLTDHPNKSADMAKRHMGPVCRAHQRSKQLFAIRRSVVLMLKR